MNVGIPDRNNNYERSGEYGAGNKHTDQPRRQSVQTKSRSDQSYRGTDRNAT